jgi:hypothetical protein
MLGFTLGTSIGSGRGDRPSAWLPLYLLLVLGVTLSPPFVQCIAGPIGLGWKPVDLLQNIVLFVPLGLALRHAPWWATLAIAVVLSGSIEVAQRWMFRDPNAADVLANLAGALLGRAIPRPRWRSLRRGEAVAIFGLAGLVALGLGLASAPRTTVSDFSNWEPFPLSLGNEPRSVNRGWPGVMTDVSIYDRAVGSGEIARWRPEDDERPWSEGGPILAARLAVPPDGRLDGPNGREVLRLTPPRGDRRIDAEGFFSNGTPWVLPEHASEHVRERLMDSGRMSVRTRVRALDLGLFAPGRIVTLSQIPGSRDFTLGQRGRNLQFRVRTPGNGRNGDHVTAFTRGGPVDLAPHEVWGVFDGNVARIYIDGQCWGDALVAATRVRNRMGNAMLSLMIAATAFTGLAVGTLVGGSLLRRRTVHFAAGAASWLSLLAVGLWRPFPDFEVLAAGIGVASLLVAAPLLGGRSRPESEA